MKFTPTSWQEAADQVDRALQDFQVSCDPALSPPPLPSGISTVDAAVHDHVGPLNEEWYFLVGGASIKLGSDSSKMRATADNYTRVEDENTDLADRYWKR